MKSKWNPRFVAYATGHGRSPEAMLEHDAERFPGGKMTGFTLWVQAKIREWAQEVGHARVKQPDAYVSDVEWREFDAWLSGGP